MRCDSHGRSAPWAAGRAIGLAGRCSHDIQSVGGRPTRWLGCGGVGVVGCDPFVAVLSVSGFPASCAMPTGGDETLPVKHGDAGDVMQAGRPTWFVSRLHPTASAVGFRLELQSGPDAKVRTAERSPRTNFLATLLGNVARRHCSATLPGGVTRRGHTRSRHVGGGRGGCTVRHSPHRGSARPRRCSVCRWRTDRRLAGGG